MNREEKTCKCGVKYVTGPLPNGGYQPYNCNCKPSHPPKKR